MVLFEIIARSIGEELILLFHVRRGFLQAGLQRELIAKLVRKDLIILVEVMKRVQKGLFGGVDSLDLVPAEVNLVAVWRSTLLLLSHLYGQLDLVTHAPWHNPRVSSMFLQ